MELVYQDNINWNNIAKGIDYYKSKGFQYLEVPWLVPNEIIKITFPGESGFKTELGDLIGSGEQSFLHLQFNNNLPLGRYMTVTPCFRDEKEDKFHKKQFLKLELYITDVVTENNLQDIILICQFFFRSAFYLGLTETKIVPISDGSFDLECFDIELGSYGIREFKGHKWIYATGIAEPRASQVVKLL